MDITAEQMKHIIDHMNEDHEESLILYAHAFANRTDVKTATMLNLTDSNVTLQIENNEQLTIPLTSPVENAKDAHMVLVGMHREALSKLEKTVN